MTKVMPLSRRRMMNRTIFKYCTKNTAKREKKMQTTNANLDQCR